MFAAVGMSAMAYRGAYTFGLINDNPFRLDLKTVPT